ncbi:MAG: hypothetical protein AAGG02_15305 [Cyanobacteria bacterium P01_H01_bin.15]
MKRLTLSTLALIASISALSAIANPAQAGAPYKDGQHPIFGQNTTNTTQNR